MAITAHRHGFLALDDLPIRACRDIQTLGAALSDRAGGVDLSGADPPACAWLSTGAESLAAALQQASPAALDVTLPDARGAGDRAGDTAPMANRGLAGCRLVEALARSRRVLVASVPDLKGEVTQSIEAALGLDESTDSKLRARLKDWVAIACAGTVGAQLGILPWSEQDCRAAVAEVASRWLDADPMGLGPQGRAILTAVGRHLAAHRAALPPFKADYPDAPVGWRCAEFLHLRAEPFFAALRPVADAHAVKRTLEDAGYLVAPDTGRSQRWRAPRWVPGQPRLLRLRLDLLAETA